MNKIAYGFSLLAWALVGCSDTAPLPADAPQAAVSSAAPLGDAQLVTLRLPGMT